MPTDPLYTVDTDSRNFAADITGPQLVQIIKAHFEATGVVFPDMGEGEGDVEGFTFTASTGAGPFGIQNGSARVTFTDNE